MIRRPVRVEAADARPEHPDGDQRGDTADGMDHGGASEVVKVQASQPAAPPHPMSDDGIDKGAQNERIRQVGHEPHPLGHRTRHDGRGGSGEHGLEQPESGEWEAVNW